MENFMGHLRQFGDLEEEQSKMILSECSELRLRKGDYFLEQGQICKRLGFISAGVMRICYFDGQDEVTRYFTKENGFGVLLESFSKQVPASDSIQALTDCGLITVSVESYRRLSAAIPAFELIAQRIIQEALLEKLQRRSPMIVEDAMTRYKKFAEQHPDILLRVPLGYVASYLGITKQSLSRLRKSFI